jgi:hypothetical protein
VSIHPSQESHVLLQRSAGSATVDEWTLALTLDKTSVDKNFKMMRNGRWRDSLKACNITALISFLAEIASRMESLGASASAFETFSTRRRSAGPIILSGSVAIRTSHFAVVTFRNAPNLKLQVTARVNLR